MRLNGSIRKSSTTKFTEKLLFQHVLHHSHLEPMSHSPPGLIMHSDMLSLSRDKCPETQWCSSSLPSAWCWRAADALTNPGCLGMTSHPNFTKGSFPLLSITQNICIQIFRFISFWSICSSRLISSCLVNTSEKLESFVKWRTASQAENRAEAQGGRTPGPQGAGAEHSPWHAAAWWDWGLVTISAQALLLCLPPRFRLFDNWWQRCIPPPGTRLNFPCCDTQAF